MTNDHNTSTAESTHAVDIVDIIRKLRNELVKDFLDERVLKEYLAIQYNFHSISHIQLEFMKADLHRLLIAPVDLTLYAPVIEEYKASGSAALTEGNERLFYLEIEKILKRNMY
jgi:hypothetical protein